MRSSIIKVAILLSMLGGSYPSFALDTTSEEAICADIGFKKKTPPFANCVLEMLDRKTANNNVVASDPDDATCRKYGFKPKTNEYGQCRMQIDQARQDAQRQQAQFSEQQRQYEAAAAEYRRQKNLAVLQMGLGMMAGGSPGNSGLAPTPPAMPQNLPRTYLLPGNKSMNCVTTGTVVNCI